MKTNHTDQQVIDAFLTIINENVLKVAPITESYSHACWKIDTEYKKYLLKLNVRKPNENAFKNELEAHRLLESMSSFSPKIIGFSTPPNDLDGYYYIQEWIEGESANIGYSELTERQKGDFGFDFGKAVAKLHTIKGECFSDDCIGLNTYPSWRDMCETRLERLIQKNKVIDILAEKQLKEVEEKCRGLLQTLPNDIIPTFTHRDLYLNNLILSKGKYKAIIDFESVKFYDPFWDFVKPEIWIFKDYPELKKPFYNGYNSVSLLPESFACRLKLCQGIEYLAAFPYFGNVQPQPEMISLFSNHLLEWLEK